jgi:hypothetical protein
MQQCSRSEAGCDAAGQRIRLSYETRTFIRGCPLLKHIMKLALSIFRWGGKSSLKAKVKVKCTLVQALRLCTGRTAHRVSRGITLLFHDHGTRRGWGVSVTPRPLFTPGKNPLPIVQEAGWAPGPIWTGAENLASTGIRSPDPPARSQSLYRLSYPAHSKQIQYWWLSKRSDTEYMGFITL